MLKSFLYPLSIRFVFFHLCVTAQKHSRQTSYIYIYATIHIFNTIIITNGHSSLEKYTSHFIERVVCERELETEQRLQHTDLTSSSGHSSVSFSFSCAAQPEAWGPAPRWDLVLTARSETLLQNSDLQLQLLNRGLKAPSTGCWFSLLHLISN